MTKQTTPSALTEEVSKNNDPKRPKAKQIFLGIDAHLLRNQVARKKDNSAIQGVQSFRFEELLLFAQKQLSLAEEVYAVYEAGPLGYVLYRRLRELGIRAYVSAPECLEQGKRKHNKLDARKLASRLYSYVQGDSEMMRVVRVPSLEQEQLRAQSRQHDQLVATRKALGALWCNWIGRSVITIALPIGAKWAVSGVLFPGSIPPERINAWVRLPKWVRPGSGL